MVYESDPTQSAYQGPVGGEMQCYMSQAPKDMWAAFAEVEGVAFRRQVHDQQAMLDHLMRQADACTAAERQAACPATDFKHVLASGTSSNTLLQTTIKVENKIHLLSMPR